MVAVPLLGFWWFYRRDMRKAKMMLAAINPLKLKFTETGLQTLEKNGASNFAPWSSFSGFREGRTVLLLREIDTSQYRVIPKDTISTTDLEWIRSAIRSHLPELP